MLLQDAVTLMLLEEAVNPPEKKVWILCSALLDLGEGLGMMLLQQR